MNSRTAQLFFLIILVGVYWYFSTHPEQSATVQNQIQQVLTPTQAPLKDVKGAEIQARTKTADCQINGSLQDLACTPGASDPNLTADVLCNPDFTTKSIRNVSSATKNQVYREYGITSHQPGQYEVDHLISLELGGSNDIANLWPEAADPRPGFHEKDYVENYLHKQVCSGALSLADAQREIATNWLQIYQTVPNITSFK